MDKNKVFLEKNKVYKDGELNLDKFNKLDVKLQTEILRIILEDDIYTGTKEFDVDNKHVLKCLKLSCDEEDNEIHLPLGLLVSKEDNVMTFEFQKKLALWFLILLAGALLFTIVGATYSAFHYLQLIELNKDIDGDGVADINIDIDNDEKADINIDLNRDDKPDVNIDYKGNREQIFNVVIGDEIINPTNVKDDKGVCIRNCDTNDDGWPDTNLDLDNDGKPDMDLDTNNDGVPDMNIDLNGDKECDIHCDTDGDGACDKNCIENWSQVIISTNGSSTIIGTPYRTSKSAELEVVYTDKSDVVIEDIMPDDMEEGSKIPTKVFTVKNKSPFYVIYNVYLIDVLNEFTSGNFKYKVDCKLNCKSFNYMTAPSKDGIIIKDVIIAPGQTHTYNMDFKLQGIGEPQNYDQGKIFKAKIQIGYDRRG